jgi:hypothetical protein
MDGAYVSSSSSFIRADAARPPGASAPCLSKRLRSPLSARPRRIHRRRHRTRARILRRPLLQPPQPILVPLDPASQLENELHTRLTPRVVDRLRLGPIHACKIRCTNKESLPRAPTTRSPDASGHGSRCNHSLPLVRGHAPPPARRARRNPRAAILAPRSRRSEGPRTLRCGCPLRAAADRRSWRTRATASRSSRGIRRAPRGRVGRSAHRPPRADERAQGRAQPMRTAPRSRSRTSARSPGASASWSASARRRPATMKCSAPCKP